MTLILILILFAYNSPPVITSCKDKTFTSAGEVYMYFQNEVKRNNQASKQWYYEQVINHRQTLSPIYKDVNDILSPAQH